MKIAGIIAEYNPFHKGHAYHLQKTREKTGCDYVIVCMDSHFTQRGEAACLSKWDRARMALSCGADAVFELPGLFAVRPAEIFARGGVYILGSLGADFLSFGCESEDISLPARLSGFLQNEPCEISEKIQNGLAAGLSLPHARGRAWAQALGVQPEELNKPNLILAAEYLRAINTFGFGMQPMLIPRIGGYHDESIGKMPSATAVRLAMLEGRTDDALSAVPESARPFFENDRGSHGLSDVMLHILRGMSAEKLGNICDMAEGLENRLLECAKTAASLDELIENAKCKRYTRARISRAIANAALGMDNALCESDALPRYARLIGMRKDAKPLLKELSARSKLPIVSGTAQIRDDAAFLLECRAADLWALGRNDSAQRRAGQEFTQKFTLL